MLPTRGRTQVQAQLRRASTRFDALSRPPDGPTDPAIGPQLAVDALVYYRIRERLSAAAGREDRVAKRRIGVSDLQAPFVPQHALPDS